MNTQNDSPSSETSAPLSRTFPQVTVRVLTGPEHFQHFQGILNISAQELMAARNPDDVIDWHCAKLFNQMKKLVSERLFHPKGTPS